MRKDNAAHSIISQYAPSFVKALAHRFLEECAVFRSTVMLISTVPDTLSQLRRQ
jgi:hypothetical protein